MLGPTQTHYTSTGVDMETAFPGGGLPTRATVGHGAKAPSPCDVLAFSQPHSMALQPQHVAQKGRYPSPHVAPEGYAAQHASALLDEAMSDAGGMGHR